ncbi:unnamed protein product [Cladocopium goreaui]|uniref:Uncharacterized protein n=1 Tax=Cladocopium goreaui TaxID=2562237 RepID=A0A9P1DFP2_9DINO|nr:unnamed protein product [Cladocopium goreaui]
MLQMPWTHWRCREHAASRSFQELRWHIALLGRCQKRFCQLPPLQRLSGTKGTLQRNNSPVAKTLTARSAHGVETESKARSRTTVPRRFPDGSHYARAEFPRLPYPGKVSSRSGKVLIAALILVFRCL